MAQSVERRLGKAEVTGPIPVISLKIKTMVHPNHGFLFSNLLASERPRPGDDFRDGNEPCKDVD